VLLRHGQKDSAVAFEHASKFLLAAQTSGKTVTAFTPSNEGHSIYQPENWQPWIDTLISFLDNNR
jgi:dipeptidyl aminopeptidase/acylaminoacyl peptidase